MSSPFDLSSSGGGHSSLGDALACLDHPALGLACKVIPGHNYLNYQYDIVGNISEQIG